MIPAGFPVQLFSPMPTGAPRCARFGYSDLRVPCWSWSNCPFSECLPIPFREYRLGTSGSEVADAESSHLARLEALQACLVQCLADGLDVEQCFPLQFNPYHRPTGRSDFWSAACHVSPFPFLVDNLQSHQIVVNPGDDISVFWLPVDVFLSCKSLSLYGPCDNKNCSG